MQHLGRLVDELTMSRPGSSSTTRTSEQPASRQRQSPNSRRRKRTHVKPTCKAAKRLPEEMVSRIALEACSLPPKWDVEGDANCRRSWLRNRYMQCLKWIGVSRQYRVLITPLLLEHIWLRKVPSYEEIRAFWSMLREPVDPRGPKKGMLRQDCVVGLHLDLSNPDEPKWDYLRALPNLEVLHLPNDWDCGQKGFIGSGPPPRISFPKLRLITNIDDTIAEEDDLAFAETLPAQLASMIARCPRLEGLVFADGDFHWSLPQAQVFTDALRVHTDTAAFFHPGLALDACGLSRLEIHAKGCSPGRELIHRIGSAAPNLKKLVINGGGSNFMYDLTDLMRPFSRLEELSVQSLCSPIERTGNLDSVLDHCPLLKNLDVCATLITGSFFTNLAGRTHNLSELRIVSREHDSTITLHAKSPRPIRRMAETVTSVLAHGLEWGSAPLLIRLQLVLDLDGP